MPGIQPARGSGACFKPDPVNNCPSDIETSVGRTTLAGKPGWGGDSAWTAPPMSLAHIRLAVLALAGLVAGALTALAVLPQARERLMPNRQVKVWGQALIGGPFSLVDHTGKRVTDTDFRGRTMLIVFGSTASPDSTASSLQVLMAALDKLGAKAERAVPILITVDPEHDTPASLKRFIERFNPRLIGLTGTTAEIDAVLSAYRVHAIGKGDASTSAAGTAIDSPSLIYVMGPDGRYRGHLSFTAGVDAVATSLAGML